MPGGTVTIVTDNLPYGRSLARIAAAEGYASSSSSSSAPSSLDRSSAVEVAPVPAGSGAVGERSVLLLPGVPEDHGGVARGGGGGGGGGRSSSGGSSNSVEGSSYFDRMWSKGKRVKRYFFRASPGERGKKESAGAAASATAAAAAAAAAGAAAAATARDKAKGILSPAELPEAVRAILTDRGSARRAKDFARCDELRASLRGLGYVVMDTGTEQRVKRAK